MVCRDIPIFFSAPPVDQHTHRLITIDLYGVSKRSVDLQPESPRYIQPHGIQLPHQILPSHRSRELDEPLINPPVIHSSCFPACTNRHPSGIFTGIRLPEFRAQICTVSQRLRLDGWTYVLDIVIDRVWSRSLGRCGNLRRSCRPISFDRMGAYS